MEIIYSKREVYVHEKPKDTNESYKDSSKIGGQLQLIKNVRKKKPQFNCGLTHTQTDLHFILILYL